MGLYVDDGSNKKKEDYLRSLNRNQLLLFPNPIHFIYIAHLKDKVSNSKSQRKVYKHNKSTVTYNTDKRQQERQTETT